MKLTYKTLQHICLLLACSLLIACAAKPTKQLRSPDWERSGKVAIQDEQQHTTLLYHWQQADEDYIIHLMNPLGKIELLLQGKNGKVSAQAADGKTHQANDAEQLLYQLTGWSFPIHDAQFWLDGKAGPKGTDLETNNDLNLVRFNSDEWQVELSRYKNQKPSRVTAEHQNLPLRVQLINKHYARFK